MRVRWNAMNAGLNANLLLKEEDVKKKIETTQIKKQIEILSTFMPDQILYMSVANLEEVQQFVGVLLFADVSGFTPLCERYNKTGKGGIYRLTATLNAYIGAIVEVIYYYGGDVLKFSGDAFLAAWKVDTDVCLFEVIHEVIVCALFIQENLGRFETEVNVLLKVKLAVACGNMTFSVIGDESSRHYVILGQAVNDVKDAEHCSVSGDVVIAPCAWGHVSQERYDITHAEHGNVKVWRCLYKPHELPIKEMYENKRGVVLKLCEKHLSHRSHLHRRKTFGESESDSKITEVFIRSLPVRTATKRAVQAWITSELRPFTIKPVLDQVEEKQPLEYLTEMREVTIQFINIVPATYYVPKLVEMIDEAYKIICHIVSQLLGIVNKVSLFDKDAMVLVLFGLRGIKHEFESQNALKSAFEIRKEISKLDGVKSVSVGVTNGLVYCGVVGHPLRREYTVIGGSVNKAARIMCAYQQKVTCDHQTYKNSKLSSAYFQLQSALKLKGIEDAGHIFEYNEDFEDALKFDQEELHIIGRNDELDLIHMIVNHPEHIGDYRGLCIKGKTKIGKTKVLRAAAYGCQQEGHCVAAIDLACGGQRSFFAVSVLYKQLYDEKTTIDNPAAMQIRHLPRNLWSFTDVAQMRMDEKVYMQKKESITNNLAQILQSTPGNKRSVLLIDNVQYIDAKSLDIILNSVRQNDAKLICAGQFDEEGTWDTLFKFSLHKYMKVIELEPLRTKVIPELICSFLAVDAIPKKLINLIDKTCEGRPGWIQSCLLRLINTGAIEVKYAKHTDASLKKYTFASTTDPSFSVIANKKKEVVCVIELFDKYNESTEELTLTAISLDLFDSFTPYQQLVIKTAAVLGEVFTRTLMIVMLKYPQEHLFACTIKQLFDEDVFDCGSRYIHSGGLFSKALCCMCFMNQEDFEDVQKFDLPKYAFCKVLHFKNKSLKAVAYELLPANQKKELHLRITEVLDNQNNACPSCLRNNSASIVNFKRFKDIVAYFCDIKETPGKSEHRPSDGNVKCSADEIKDIIRKGIHKYTTEEEMYNDPKFRDTVIPTRKLYDPTICFCLEILTRVYADLVYHSECAGHLGKRVFFLVQYSKVLITMNEFKEAIALLSEASDLFTVENMNLYLFPEKFRKYNKAKIHLLMCEAHISLKDYEAAQNHVRIALRMFDIPMLTLKYKLIGKIVFHRFMLTQEGINMINAKKEESIWFYDIGLCFNMISIIAAAQNNWKVAKIAAMKAIETVSIFNPNIQLLCDTYANAINLHNFLGDQHCCQILERCVNKQKLQQYSAYTLDMLSLNKLLCVLFLTKVMNGRLSEAVRIGYRCFDITRMLQTYYVENQMTPILATILLLNGRIDDAVQLAKILYVNGKKYDETALVSYYAFCLELIVETSFTLEPAENARRFAEEHFENGVTRDITHFENKLILYLLVYYLRNRSIGKVHYWRLLYQVSTDEKNHHIQNILNLFKYTEFSLERLVHVSNANIAFPVSEVEKIWTLLEQCRIVADKWNLLKPRYLHYKAYFYRLKDKRSIARKLLRDSMDLAIQQDNILEQAWVTINNNVWNGGFSFDGAASKSIKWQQARTYNILQWSQIMYSLPYTTIVDY